MVEVLNESTGGSWITQNHIRQRVLSRSFDDPFKLELMLKDIGIALELGREIAAADAAVGPGPAAVARRGAGRRAGRQRQRAGALGRAAGGDAELTPGAGRSLREHGDEPRTTLCRLRLPPAGARGAGRRAAHRAPGAAGGHRCGRGRRGRGRHRAAARAAARARRHAQATSFGLRRQAAGAQPPRSSTAPCAARSTTATRWRRASTSARR